MSVTNRRKMGNKNDECSQRIKFYKNTRHGTPEGTRYTKEHPAETPDGNSPPDCCILLFESLLFGIQKRCIPKGIHQKQDVSIPSTPLRGASEMEKDSPTG